MSPAAGNSSPGIMPGPKIGGPALSVPLGDRHVVARRRASEELARPADLHVRVLDHLGPLRHPADRPRDREQRGEHRGRRSEEHTSELQSPCNLVCRLLLEKKKKKNRLSPPHTKTSPPKPH